MADPFKAYDIRGLYPSELDEQLAYHIGNAMAQVLGLAGKRFAVGRDMRVSGPALKQHVVKGLVDAGVIVVDVGLLSTPALTFAMHHLDTAGGAQITASHNPSGYGGVKITGPGFKPIGAGTGMEEIEKLARAKKVAKAPGGRIDEALTLHAYAAFLAPLLDLKRPLKVVVDGGNGIIGVLFQHLAPLLPNLTIVPMFFDPDGRFPNHDANPLKAENLAQLIARVKAEKADFGAGFDGDGDRCALVDEEGKIVSCDLTTALLAQHFLAKEKGKDKGAIVYDLRSSKVVPEFIRQLGGTPVETRVGHSFIKKTMKDHHAAFAGELSGHYYFRDFFGADSGLYAFLLLANVISAAPSLSSLIRPLSKYFHTGEINFKVASGEAVMENLRAFGKRICAEVVELDGVTVRATHWWCNLRASNTEPVVRLNLEADTASLRDAKLAEVKALITGQSATAG
ncbi:MAG TPA: phosphomannomutase/phosphoglucomutase [Planctomycetota bacterium]|nr:phosphomannomutase/phosphoglucomutase [Planctomycetota bacterium]